MEDAEAERDVAVMVMVVSGIFVTEDDALAEDVVCAVVVVLRDDAVDMIVVVVVRADESAVDCTDVSDDSVDSAEGSVPVSADWEVPESAVISGSDWETGEKAQPVSESKSRMPEIQRIFNGYSSFDIPLV